MFVLYTVELFKL